LALLVVAIARDLVKNPRNKGVRVGKDWNKRFCPCTIPVRSGSRIGCCPQGGQRVNLLSVLGGLVLIATSQSVPGAGETPRGTVAAFGAAQERRAARGWIELEQEQRAYRNRLGSLDLKRQRQLETLERSQQLDLRALQQRDARAIDRVERQQRIIPQANLNAYRRPARDAAADIRQRAERHRVKIRGQQDGRSFRRH
jgi:hypothetical protein